jgi:toxin ParE1/3/4
MKYRFSDTALTDLENIWLYTRRHWSINQADEYVQIIFSALEFLTNNPNTGKSYGQIRLGYFGLKIKSHIVFYQINKNEDYIFIVRILHQQMDIENRLFD